MRRHVIVWGIGLGAAALLLNVAAAFLWVLVYSLAVAPGHDGAFYQAYGQSIAPLSGIVFGLPMLFAAGWLVARRARRVAAGMVPAIAYALLDLALIAIGGLWPSPAALAISYLTKLAAGWGGGAVALRRQ